MKNSITLSSETISLLSPACKLELAAHLGFEVPQTSEDFLLEDGDAEYAELGIQAARAFLQGCGEKTTRALGFMVSAGDSFSLHTLASQMGVEQSTLKGVWTGLTKRVRTITGDPDAQLIEWGDQQENGDFKARLMPVTREAFRRALAENDI